MTWKVLGIIKDIEDFRDYKRQGWFDEYMKDRRMDGSNDDKNV